jgi:hypothetical protein
MHPNGYLESKIVAFNKQELNLPFFSTLDLKKAHKI